MTFTLTALRDDIEEDLRDTGNANWSTAQLDRAIDKALERYTRVRPRQRSSALTGISGRTITLSAAAPAGLGTTDYAALIEVIAVEYRVSQWPPEYVRFNVYGATLQLHVDTELDSEAVTIYWTGQHTLDGSGGTIIDPDRDVLAHGACGYALRQFAIDNSQTVNVQPRLARQMDQLADDYLARFDEDLARIRASQGVRQVQAYRPDDGTLHQDVVRWPGA